MAARQPEADQDVAYADLLAVLGNAALERYRFRPNRTGFESLCIRKVRNFSGSCSGASLANGKPSRPLTEGLRNRRAKKRKAGRRGRAKSLGRLNLPEPFHHYLYDAASAGRSAWVWIGRSGCSTPSSCTTWLFALRQSYPYNVALAPASRQQADAPIPDGLLATNKRRYVRYCPGFNRERR
jgi:hypothetical protein